MVLFCLGYYYCGYVLSAGVIDDIVLSGLLLLWLCFVSGESLKILFCLGYYYYGYTLSESVGMTGQFLPLALLFIMCDTLEPIFSI